MPINILSLFDWISCGQIALNNIWIRDFNYSEQIEYDLIIF